MKQHPKKSMPRLIALFLFAWILCGDISATYAAPSVPQTIKVGLSYGNAANNNFAIKSEGGVKVSVNSNSKLIELFSYSGATGIVVRKEAYYNIVNNKENEINYVKAAVYRGELEGPYHIQIGEVYADINAAKQVADSMSSLSQTVYLAYENGWRVWAQLYLDEGECQTQIGVFKNEKPEYTYSVIPPDKRRVQLFDGGTGKLIYILNAEQDIKIEPLPPADGVPIISFGTVKYRGSLGIKRIAAGPINIYNELPFEQYLYGVVPSEMPSSWNMEALKAQAVAARNYAILSSGKHTADGFDICNGQHCQVYGGYSNEKASTNQAVEETKGKLVLYNGQPITSYFHSSSGGRTESSENVWSAALPYLTAVDDKYSVGSPYDNWTKTYSTSDLKEKLAAGGMDVGDIVDLVPLEYSVNGRVTVLEIKGTKKTEKLVKEKIRSVLGSSDIKSIWYKVTTDADIYMKDTTENNPAVGRAGTVYVLSASGVQKMPASSKKLYIKNQDTVIDSSLVPSSYIFNGKGWGHGVGMSQYGAKGMAEAGFDYIQILEYYYTGAKVK
jgi:stage II sporulation protein D